MPICHGPAITPQRSIDGPEAVRVGVLGDQELGRELGQRTSVLRTRTPSSAVSFLPSSRERALYVIGTS